MQQHNESSVRQFLCDDSSMRTSIQWPHGPMDSPCSFHNLDGKKGDERVRDIEAEAANVPSSGTNHTVPPRHKGTEKGSLLLCPEGKLNNLSLFNFTL